MDELSGSLNGANITQIILLVLFIIYFVLGLDIPSPVANVIDTTMGKIVVVVSAIILFAYSNPILGVIGLIIAFDLIQRSSVSTGTHALANYVPTEKKKASNLSAMNQYPYTLEQEVVKQMAPINKTTTGQPPPEYKPVLLQQYDAAPINYNGVV
jgi:hypothetical protein